MFGGTNGKETEGVGMGSSSKRLLFDRRYGWVFDEWKDPSEEALAAGRGMFCIVPLANAFLKTASNSINFAARSVVEVLEKPDVLSPKSCKLASKSSLEESQILYKNHNSRVSSLWKILSCWQQFLASRH